MTTTGTTWDNLKLSFAGATEMPRNIIVHESHECNEGTGVLQNAPTQRLTPESIKAFILLWIEAAFTQNFTPKNYTHPSLAGITG